MSQPERVGAGSTALASLFGNYRAPMLWMALVSLVGAMLEAGFLVLVTAIAMALVAGESAVGPMLGQSMPLRVGLGLAAAALIVRLVLNFLGVRISATLTARVTADQRTTLAHAYLGSSWAVQQREPSGRLQELLTPFVTRVSNSVATLLPGINKVPPGSTVRWTHRAGWGQPEAYWRLVDVAQSGVDQPLEHPGEALHELESLLAQSVRRRLIADVPLGAFLSGGIDSTTIVAIGQSVSERPLHTFTVSVGGTSDEAEHAAQIARHLGTNHETLPLPELSPLDLAQTAIDIHDEPFADPSSMPMAVVCAAARKRVKVCLSGDGGDELFAGYNRHRVAVGTLTKVLALPGLPRRAFAAGLSALRPGTWNAIATVLGQPTLDMGTKAHKLATALRADSVSGAYESLAAQWDPSAVLVNPVPPAPTPVPHLLTESDLEQILLQEQIGLLPDDMLVKGDLASMSAGLELRLPLLEHRIVELSWRLPPQAKFRNGRGKWPLRWILEQHVPPSLWDRPKTGFDPPLADWLRGPLREWAHDLLSPNELSRHSLLRPEPISEMLTAHMSGRRNHDYQLWTILMLQGWLDKQNRISQGASCDGV